jgi:hypothetical protein
LFAASNVEELGKAFQVAKQQNPKIDTSSYEKFVKTVNEESSKLTNDKKFIDQVTRSSGKQALTPEEIKQEAEKLVFKNAKSDFDKRTVEGLKKVVFSANEAIKDLKVDRGTLSEMKKSDDPDTLDAAKVYERLLNVYNRINADLGSR